VRPDVTFSFIQERVSVCGNRKQDCQVDLFWPNFTNLATFQVGWRTKFNWSFLASSQDGWPGVGN